MLYTTPNSSYPQIHKKFIVCNCVCEIIDTRNVIIKRSNYYKEIILEKHGSQKESSEESRKERCKEVKEAISSESFAKQKIPYLREGNFLFIWWIPEVEP